MRLRQALQDSLIAAPSPRRMAQLRIVRDLEAAMLALARALDRHTISTTAALHQARVRFAAAEPAIGADIAELLGGGAEAAEAIIATIGTGARPAA
jgi:hypothetical protein